MMRLIVIVILLLGISFESQALMSTGQRKEKRSKKYFIKGRENAFFITSATGVTSHNQLLSSLKVEYNRQIRGILFWGGAFSLNKRVSNIFTYDIFGEECPCRNTIDHDIYKIDGMLYCRLSVIQSRLFLRLGTGLGIGFLQAQNKRQYGQPGNKVLPYFNFECAWIVRYSKHFEMKFSPTLLFVPTTFSVSPVKMGYPTDQTPWMSDLGFSIAFGYRF